MKTVLDILLDRITNTGTMNICTNLFVNPFKILFWTYEFTEQEILPFLESHTKFIKCIPKQLTYQPQTEADGQNLSLIFILYYFKIFLTVGATKTVIAVNMHLFSHVPTGPPNILTHSSHCSPVCNLLLSRENWEACHSLIKINGGRKSLIFSPIFSQDITVSPIPSALELRSSEWVSLIFNYFDVYMKNNR